MPDQVPSPRTITPTFDTSSRGGESGEKGNKKGATSGETRSGYFEREASTLTNATEKPCEMKTKKKGTIGSGHVETLTRAPVMGAED